MEGERQTAVGRIKTARDACAKNVIIYVIVATLHGLNDAIEMLSESITRKTRRRRGSGGEGEGGEGRKSEEEEVTVGTTKR